MPVDPTTYAMDRTVADAEALRVRLGFERMDLLGHSAAGGSALLYAARYPERTGHLMLVAPSVQLAGIEMTDEQWYAQIERRARRSARHPVRRTLGSGGRAILHQPARGRGHPGEPGEGTAPVLVIVRSTSRQPADWAELRS